MQKVLLSIIGVFVALSVLADDSVITPVTTKDYVDNVISDKQPLSPITGVNKIMTYGATTGAQTGSRDIETTSLGTDTTADKVAAAGIIVAALNNKQNNVIGTDDWVMTGTNTAGNLGGKPIYSSTNNYSNALVTAETVNNAAIAAANSEFSCETYVEGAEQIPDNCLIWRIHTDGPTTLPTPRTSVGDPMIQGSLYCKRDLNGSDGEDSQCGPEILSYIGPRRNRSGKWGVVFPYGNVMGISVCSSVSATSSGQIATDAESETLDAEYATQVENGTQSGNTCWCKIVMPATSKYVAQRIIGSGCAALCASQCSNYIKGVVQFRGTMFNTIHQ